MLANSIPIYWGNPMVDKDFNTGSFINIPNVKSFEAAIEKIIELDKNEKKYLAMAAQPWFVNNELPAEFTNENFASFIDFVITDIKEKKPVGASIVRNSFHKMKLFRNKIQNTYYHRLGGEGGFR